MTAKRGTLSLRTRDTLEGYSLILPWIIGFIVFGAFPIFYSLFLSFTKWNIVGKAQWVGVRNFVRMFDLSRSTGTEFVKSVYVTFYYSILSIPARVVLAITLALLLRRPIKGRRFCLTVLYLPSVISGVSMALMWKWIFHNRFGLVNGTLKALASKAQTGFCTPARQCPPLS